MARAYSGAIQPLERAAARIRIRLRVRVDRGLERADEALIGRGVGTRHARRRHHARLQLANHALGHVRILAGLGDIERREREAARAILVAIVVTADAVALHERVVIRVSTLQASQVRPLDARPRAWWRLEVRVGADGGAGVAGCCAASAVTSPRHTTAVPREMEPTLFIPKSPRDRHKGPSAGAPSVSSAPSVRPTQSVRNIHPISGAHGWGKKI